MADIPHPIVGEWVAQLKQQGKSESTLANYRRAVVHFAAWSEQSYGESFDPAAIIPRDIVDWKAHQQTVEKVKPGTFNLRLVGLSRFFKWAVARGHVESDPTTTAQSIRLEMRRPKSLEGTYVRRLLRQIRRSGSKRDEAIAEVLLGTGLRVAELLALQRGDVNINKGSGEVIVRRGKRGLYRQVPLTRPVRQALRAYLDTRPHLFLVHLDFQFPFFFAEDLAGLGCLDAKRVSKSTGSLIAQAGGVSC